MGKHEQGAWSFTEKEFSHRVPSPHNQRRRAIEALEARAPFPDRIAMLVNSLQNRVNSITRCATLNVNTGKIVLVTLCIQRLNGCFIMCFFSVKLSHGK